MKRLKRLYFIPSVVAILAACVLLYLLFPKEYYRDGILLVLVPLSIMAVGVHMITFARINRIRTQLHQIISTLEEFDIDEPKKVEFSNSPFPVFNELNEYIVELVDRIHAQFMANNQFTQNASHELQTPLAVIKGQVELLLQSPNLGEKEVGSLGIVLQNVNRLSKLNSALILLSKIENQGFVDNEGIEFSKVTGQLLMNFQDQIEMQNIEIKKAYVNEFNPEMSRALAEILIANLLQNAIRHNLPKGGFISINMDSESFSVSNSGQNLVGKPEQLFQRFKRESEVEEGLGLGLSIIQRICEKSDLHLTYEHSDGIHTLTLNLKK